MATKLTLSPLRLALGAAFASSLAGTSVANSAENPFVMTPLSSGYLVAAEGSCGEGKCGGSKGGKTHTEGSCGEGMCGMNAMDTNKDGNVSREEFTAHHEKMFAKMDANSDGMISESEMGSMEGKCGEGKCGGATKGAEGKCGEGKCGGSK